MAKQSPRQREIVGRIMHEFKQGDLASSSGQEVTDPRQAIAIALHEAGASRDETPAGNPRDLARTKAKEEKAAPARSPKSGGGGSRAAPRAKAAKRSTPS